jgi:hypothetical protein
MVDQQIILKPHFSQVHERANFGARSQPLKVNNIYRYGFGFVFLENSY